MHGRSPKILGDAARASPQSLRLCRHECICYVHFRICKCYREPFITGSTSIHSLAHLLTYSPSITHYMRIHYLSANWSMCICAITLSHKTRRRLAVSLQRSNSPTESPVAYESIPKAVSTDKAPLVGRSCKALRKNPRSSPLKGSGVVGR